MMEFSTSPQDGDSARLREMLHRVNNYLSAVMTNSENALAKGDVAAMRAALEKILKETELVEADLRRTRREMDH